jgi:hypothetical protein
VSIIVNQELGSVPAGNELIVELEADPAFPVRANADQVRAGGPQERKIWIRQYFAMTQRRSSEFVAEASPDGDGYTQKPHRCRDALQELASCECYGRHGISKKPGRSACRAFLCLLFVCSIR